MTRTLLVLLACVVCLAHARADDDGLPAAARLAFQEGRYAEARHQAEAQATAPALAFAARAVIADAITRPDGFCMDCLKQAQALARKAAALDPGVVEAHLQEAVALGFLGRAMGIAAARREGLAEKVRATLDRALALDPGNPWAEASLGAWHLEIVTHAGPLLASILYGADETEGLALYRRGLGKIGDEPMLRYQFALALLARGTTPLENEAGIILQQIATSTQSDALARFVRSRSARLLDVMAAGQADERARLVRALQGYGP